MEGEQEGAVGVEPGSPPAADQGQAPVDPSAGTQNTDPTTGQPRQAAQTVPYARFQQVNAQARQQAQQIQHLSQQLQEFKQRSEQQGGLSRDEQMQYGEAAAALMKVMESNPRLAGLLKLVDQMPRLTQTMQGVDNLTKSQAQAAVKQGELHIKGLAEKAGFDVKNQKNIGHLVRMVAQEVYALPDGEARYDAGDLSVLDEAFANIQKEFIGAFARPANAALLKTKQATANLPPAPRGGFAGQPARAKPVEGKEREYTQGLHKDATSMLDRLLGG